MKQLISAAVLLLLASCAHSPYPTAVPNEVYLVPSPGECVWVKEHVTSELAEIPAGFHCNLEGVARGDHGANDVRTTSAHAGVASSEPGCSWVRPYARSDGTVVSGHFRCANQPSGTRLRDSLVTTDSVRKYEYRGGRSGGSTYVRGHYRKDGTYVRPHTRSAPRRRR